MTDHYEAQDEIENSFRAITSIIAEAKESDPGFYEELSVAFGAVNKDQNDRGVGQWSPSEVMRFAIEGNHSALYMYCRLQRDNPRTVTWEKAMQAAAVEMAKQLDETKKFLLDAAMQNPMMPALARFDCGTKYKRKSQGWPHQCQASSSEPPASVEDLAALVRQLAYSLKKVSPDSGLPERAVDYLRRFGLQGSPLR